MSDTLREAIERLSADRRSLVVVNHGEPDERLSEVFDYFDVADPERVTAPGLPASMLVVTDGERCLAAVDVDDVYGYLFESLGDGLDQPRDFDGTPSDLTTRVQGFLAAMDDHVYTVSGSGKVPMIRVSRHIE